MAVSPNFAKGRPEESSFVSELKKDICFDVRQLQGLKVAFQKCGVISFIFFIIFGPSHSIKQPNGLKVCTLVAVLWLYDTHFEVLDKNKSFDFHGISF